MRRRSFLGAIGLGLSVPIAGCLGSGAPEAANEYGYDMTESDGVAVPLVPLADAIEWYRDEQAVFADARSRAAYDSAHIAGAVHSPAPDGYGSNDPLSQFETEQTIVTYCGCPHHLSALRASSLIGNGYVHSYAIDEGFFAWQDAGYPLEGTNVDSTPASYQITGQDQPSNAGAYAWVWHDQSGQREAAPIQGDGRFSLTIHFHDVTPSSVLRVVTPSGETSGPLADLVGSDLQFA